MPPIPKANPKNSPATVPVRPGSRSCPQTTMAGKPHARITPIRTGTTPVPNTSAGGGGQRVEARTAVAFGPVPNVKQHERAEHRGERKPRAAGLAVWQDDERGKQRAGRRSNIPADLEDRLCKTMLAAGCHARNTR